MFLSLLKELILCVQHLVDTFVAILPGLLISTIDKPLELRPHVFLVVWTYQENKIKQVAVLSSCTRGQIPNAVLGYHGRLLKKSAKVGPEWRMIGNIRKGRGTCTQNSQKMMMTQENCSESRKKVTRSGKGVQWHIQAGEEALEARFRWHRTITCKGF